MKLTIITPCSRAENLPKLYESMNFSLIDKWIIVYDTSKNRSYNRIYTENPKIIETECDDIGATGHPQRNFGMNFVTGGFLYFLDDDNIMHSDFWLILPTLNKRYIYSWNQEKSDGSITQCEIPIVNAIDTAMFIVPYELIQDTKWVKHLRWADGIFITSIYEKHKERYAYIPRVLCYYNKLE